MMQQSLAQSPIATGTVLIGNAFAACTITTKEIL